MMSNVIEMKSAWQHVRKELAEETVRRGMNPRITEKVKRMSKDDLSLLANKMQWLTGKKINVHI